MRQEVVALRSPNQLKKTASEIEDYKLEVFGLRKQMDDVKFSSDRSHPGELKLDTALGSKVWSCCKMGQNAVGCQKHTKN